MKKKFGKGFEKRKSRVEATGIGGEWAELPNVTRFGAATGAILNFWEFSGPKSSSQRTGGSVQRSGEK
jgi:hypothetical protein